MREGPQALNRLGTLVEWEDVANDVDRHVRHLKDFRNALDRTVKYLAECRNGSVGNTGDQRGRHSGGNQGILLGNHDKFLQIKSLSCSDASSSATASNAEESQQATAEEPDGGGQRNRRRRR